MVVLELTYNVVVYSGGVGFNPRSCTLLFACHKMIKGLKIDTTRLKLWGPGKSASVTSFLAALSSKAATGLNVRCCFRQVHIQ